MSYAPDSDWRDRDSDSEYDVDLSESDQLECISPSGRAIRLVTRTLELRILCRLHRTRDAESDLRFWATHRNQLGYEQAAPQAGHGVPPDK